MPSAFERREVSSSPTVSPTQHLLLKEPCKNTPALVLYILIGPAGHRSGLHESPRVRENPQRLMEMEKNRASESLKFSLKDLGDHHLKRHQSSCSEAQAVSTCQTGKQN